MAIVYYFIILPLSYLPLKVLYGLSSILDFIFYYIIGYRKKVANINLANSFPLKTNEQRKKIARAFYKHFSDVILEGAKFFSINESEVRRRLICTNPEVANRYFEEGKSIVLAAGHFNNWEFIAMGLNLLVKHQVVVIYKSLKNPFFDKKLRASREKFGLKLAAKREVKAIFDKEKSDRTITIFAIDQSPTYKSKPYWTTFLNQETAVAYGLEKYAKFYDYPVLYIKMEKVKRGIYHLEFEEVCKKPRESPFGEITEKATKILEKEIEKNPQYWLWTHRRWKHKRPEGQVNGGRKQTVPGSLSQ